MRAYTWDLGVHLIDRGEWACTSDIGVHITHGYEVHAYI